MRLQEDFDLALLFRRIATIELDAPTIENVDEMHWTGPTAEFVSICEELEAPALVTRAVRLAEKRA